MSQPDSSPHTSLPGLRYGGTRNYVYDNGRSERLHVLTIDHENGPWDVIRCKTEAQARELVSLFEQLEAALGALREADRLASVAHDAIWSKDVAAAGVLHDNDRDDSAQYAIWRLHEVVRPLIDDSIPASEPNMCVHGCGKPAVTLGLRGPRCDGYGCWYKDESPDAGIASQHGEAAAGDASGRTRVSDSPAVSPDALAIVQALVDWDTRWPDHVAGERVPWAEQFDKCHDELVEVIAAARSISNQEREPK